MKPELDTATEAYGALTGQQHERSAAPTPTADINAEKALYTLDAAFCGATVVRSFDRKLGQRDITSLLLELDAKIKGLLGGDMSSVEAMLFAQAMALQSIFVDLATRAQQQDRPALMQTLMAMAMKAQAQCRATLEALAELKLPRHRTYVQQQNVAQQQLVNNPVPVVLGQKPGVIASNKLLTEQIDAQMEHGGTRAASGNNSYLEAVASSDRAGHVGRKKANR